jgi:hypothetical protein
MGANHKGFGRANRLRALCGTCECPLMTQSGHGRLTIAPHAHNIEVGRGDTELDLFSGIRSSKSVTRGRDGGRLPFSRSVEWGYRYGEFVNHSVGNNHQDPRVRCTCHECTAQARLRGTPPLVGERR